MFPVGAIAMYREADWENRKRKVSSVPKADLPLVGVPLLDAPPSKSSTNVEEGRARPQIAE